jgi:hypothetical protein
MKRLVVLFLLTLLISSFADARMRHGGLDSGASVQCPFGTALPDGCPDSYNVGGTGVSGLYKYNNFWVDAPQSGQTWAGSRPARFSGVNLACIDYYCGPWTADASLVRVSTATSTQALNMTVGPDNPSGVSGVCGAYDNTNKYIRCNTDKWEGTGHVNPANGNQWLVDTTNTGAGLGPPASGQRIQFGCNPDARGQYCNSAPLITGTCASVGGLACFTFDGPAITDAAAQNVSTACGSGVSPDFNLCAGAITLYINGWWFDDAGLFSTGRGNVIMKNFRATIGILHCTVYSNGSALISLPSGYTIDATSWIGNLDSNCQGPANMYKEANDPGLSTLATFQGVVANGILTVAPGTTTGTITTNQFLDYSGRTAGKQLQLWKPDTVVSCTGSACDNTQWEVAQGPCNRNSGQNTCSTDTTWNVSSTTMTVGPVMPSAPYFLAGGGYWTKAHLAYVFSDGSYAYQGTAMEGLTFEYSNCRIKSWAAEHASCYVPNPATPTATTRPYYTAHYMTAWYDKYARPGYGTANITLFATSGTANSGPSGWQLGTDVATWDHVFVFSNNSINTGGAFLSPDSPKVTGGMISVLNQGAGGATNFPGFINTLNLTHNTFGTIGADSACRVDDQVPVTTSNISDNYNLDTGGSYACPDSN